MFPSQSYINISFFQPQSFLMTGIPGLETVRGWISIPFSSMYTMALTGNCLILLAVKRTHSLHQPMYYFLCMLALSDVGLTLSTMPSTLAVLWFDYRFIGFHTCLIQMFFLHSFSVVESSVLLAMSFDRFVAISNPLRYTSVLTNNVIIRIGAVIVARATLSLFPVPFLLKRLNYCPGKVLLSHSFCFHADVMKLACADITVNILYGLYVVLSTVGVDSLLIVMSYVLILHTVMGLASPRERVRALNTCIFSVSVQIENITSPWNHALFAILFQHILLPTTVFPDDWHPRARGHPWLDLHPLLLYVHCGTHWKLPHPPGCEEDP
ncbi:olfactory receptor 51I2-like protein [Cricetulus griseus]|uniref:Olfactory receptor n=1 Tax=Cricetulus griseus TaxID=10029 RepID=A0A061I8F3_CRIGR|nr:olfactory receptor 51I2-like protein [Cricetulus griseus]